LLNLCSGAKADNPYNIAAPDKCHGIWASAKPSDGGEALLSVIETVIFELNRSIEIELIDCIEGYAVLGKVGLTFPSIPLEQNRRSRKNRKLI